MTAPVPSTGAMTPPASPPAQGSGGATPGRSILAYFGGSLGATTLSLCGTLLVTRWTPPHQLGMWNLALLISTYVSFLQLGVFNGMNRQLPYHQGRQDAEAAQRVAQVGAAWCLMLSAGTAAFIAGAALFFGLRGEWDALQTALAIGVVVMCSWSLQFLTVGYATQGTFGPLARKTTLVALAGLPLTLLVHVFGYIGLLVRAAALAVLGSLALHHERPLRAPPAWNRVAFVELARIGFPIWLLGQLGALFMTLDRLVLADSSIALGHYTIAAQFAALAIMVPTAFNAVLYPNMARHYGEHHSAMALWKMALPAAAASAACSLGVAAICWVAIPPFVQAVLPAYVPGITAAQWATLSGVAMALGVFGNLFNVLGRQDVYLLCALGGLIAFAVAWFALTRWLDQAPLPSAAQAMLVATFTSSLLSMALGALLCRAHDRRRLGLPAPAAT